MTPVRSQCLNTHCLAHCEGIWLTKVNPFEAFLGHWFPEFGNETERLSWRWVCLTKCSQAKSHGFKVQAVTSFHQCGNNVGDPDTHTTMWVLRPRPCGWEMYIYS